MNADDLRACAADIREKANGFFIDWTDPPRVDIDREGTCDNCAQGKHLVAAYPDDDSETWLCTSCAAYTDHTAAWTRPAVALVVADWLDEEAAYLDAGRWTAIGGVPLRRGASDAAIAFVKMWRRES